ncbi:MAG: helix-turn-helix transcriptional regulator [Tepidisphaeraceae bacterium]
MPIQHADRQRKRKDAVYGSHTEYQPVKALLLKMRQDAKLTQRDLAKRVRRPQPWVHKSEVGERRVDIAEFLAWCIACRVDPMKAFAELLER